MLPMAIDKKNVLVLQSLVERCDIHALRLETACTQMTPYLPLKAEQISTLTVEQLNMMEMLLSRFGKLQDTLGAKLFPLLLQLSEEGEYDLSFLDKLHHLEKLRLLSSAKWWLKLRDLRNHLSHEYPDQPQLMADNVNQAVAASRELLEYWHNLREKVVYIKTQWLQEL
jgi:hypothetical protein